MLRTLLSGAAIGLLLTGAALAEGGELKPDPAAPVSQAQIGMQLANPTGSLSGSALSVGTVLPAGVTTYAHLDGYTYIVDPGSRRIMQIVN